MFKKCKRTKLKNKGLTVIEVTIIASITLVLGLFLLGISTGLFFNTTLDLTKETDKGVQKLRGLLLIEAINYTLTDNVERALVVVRNIAKQPIDLTVTKIDLYSVSRNEASGETIYKYQGSIPRTTFGNLSKLGIGKSETLEAPTCPGCRMGTELIYRVWYVPSSLYDEKDPFKYVSEMTYAQASIIKPVGEAAPLACPLPQDWVLVDKVDPITIVELGEMHPVNKVYIKPAFASYATYLDVFVSVQEVGGGRGGYGFGRIPVPAYNDIPISGEYAGARAPFTITISSDWSMIPGVWYFDGLYGEIHVSGITLLWLERGRVVYSVMVELGAGSSGNYEVLVTLKDCNLNVVAKGSSIVKVLEGMRSITTFIDLDRMVRFDQVYVVETSIRKLS